MKNLKIACSELVKNDVVTSREKIDCYSTDFTDVAAVVVTAQEKDIIKKVSETKLGIPVFVILSSGEILDAELSAMVYSIIDKDNKFNGTLQERKIEAAAADYEARVLPPFFGKLKEYVEKGNTQFDCPGHQGGQYFRKHPAGRMLYEFFGENVFRSDICNADVALGDLLIHEGPAVSAEEHAAKVYNADKTYFVMNGTSSSNQVAIKAAVAPGDLVLFDRNNHKSNYIAALVQAGGNPVYLETARNPFGFIGGIDAHCFEEEYIRAEIAKVDPSRAKAERPFRLAIIQLGTYDGTIYNARQVVDKIGHLCDYILFDSAWVGYEQFIPMMRNCSPLLLDLNENDPGIFVTQSVHKQQAGFSQTSQIHKKDSHIRGQKRYIDHKHFNNSFMAHASTSPFYPLFAALDVNAKMQEGEAGRKLWHDCVTVGIEARKMILDRCEMFKPFIPTEVNGKKWGEYPTEEIANNIEFFKFHPGQKWHSFDGYAEDQYFVDPNKFMLTTPGIDAETGEYEAFGIPANILANYLRENGIIPEKNDLNSILFLMTPAETINKMQNLVSHLVRFETLIKEDALLKDVIPTLYYNNEARYNGYTIRQLCQEMHDFYKESKAKDYQKQIFRHDSFPERAMTPYEANVNYIRNNCKLVALENIVGEIALEGALPYPPGVFCVVPGEKWTEIVQKYFLILEEGINKFPGFAPEIQGVYLEEQADGNVKAFGYVLNK
ncbi:ornithine decarboxylase [uncultured Clostridium sp.]|uniref:ornithine decarboxylase n=2 Tax=Bacteria TaxID=2 RepID=UPI0026300CAF|nr:ornithine decarboxylase [uncultured Clostridium sp.]